MPAAPRIPRRRRGLTCALVALLSTATGTVVAIGTSSGAFAQTATSAGWRTSGIVSPASVVAGNAVQVTVTVKSATTRAALVDVEITDGVTTVSQTAWDQQAFKAGKQRTYVITWTSPINARVGSYTVSVGIFGTGWGALQQWNQDATTFDIATTVAPTTTTRPPATTTTVAPTTTLPATTTTQPNARHFATLPVGAALPTEAQCASAIRPASEIRPSNATVNHTTGSQPLADDPRVTGNFTGTTDEIIQWAACKWGLDEDIVRAQIAKESYWKHATGGDLTTDQSQCYPSLRTTDGSACPESYGLGQVRYPYHMSAMTDSIRSSAFNLDYTYSRWRSCYEGTETWLNQYERGKDYSSGDVWGCVGLWFAGRWYTQPADDYIAAVQSNLNQRIWETPSFISFTG